MHQAEKTRRCYPVLFVCLFVTVGTPHFMAPELSTRRVPKTGDILKAADVWAIGVITCLIVTGKPPFDGFDAEDVQRAAIS